MTDPTLSAQDLLRFQMCDDPQLAPDGSAVAWVRTWMDPATNSYRARIVVTELASGAERVLTSGPGQDTHPRWSPDGAFIAFLSGGPSAVQPDGPPSAVTAVGGGPQLSVVPAAGGSARALTNLHGGARAPVWSPDGTQLAVLTLVDPARGLELLAEPPAAPATDYEKYTRDVVVTHRLRWKSDAAGFLGDYYSQIALVPFDPAGGGPAPARLLTSGAYDLSAPAWSPDGQRLATTGNIAPGGEALRKSYIYLLDAAQTTPQQPQPVFALEEMRSSDISWSPDGRTLAVCGHDDPVIGHYGTPNLWLIELSDAGGPASGRCITEALDRALGDYSRNGDMRRYGGDDRPRWLPDGSGLLLLVNEAGTVHLHRLDMGGGALTALTSGDAVVSAFTTDAACTTAVVLLGDSLNPGDLYALNPLAKTAAEPRRLTAVNAELLGNLALSDPIRYQCVVDGVTIDGWINPPVNRAPGQRYPVILYTGGGPGGMRASVFVHEFQLYAASGYAVINCNTHGNHGYGQLFSVATRGRWGDRDYLDNIGYLRAACAEFDFLDATRLAVAGGSYGGYSAAWIIARHPEFRAAVVDRSLVNRTSQVGTSDIGFLLDQVEFDRKLPWQVTDTLIERSPITYVAGVKTPTLVVHSALDHRCPVEQGEQYYMALKRLGVPTELVRFPDESHELSRSGRPWHRVFRLERYLAWFGRWL